MNAQNNFEKLLEFKTLEEVIEYETCMLSFRFLSEVEKAMYIQNMSKSELAKKVNTSTGYITQLFRGDRIPSLEFLIKISNVLNIKFEVNSKPQEKETKISQAWRNRKN